MKNILDSNWLESMVDSFIFILLSKSSNGWIGGRFVYLQISRFDLPHNYSLCILLTTIILTDILARHKWIIKPSAFGAFRSRLADKGLWFVYLVEY